MPEIRDHVRAILLAIGEDPDRAGLKRTPERVERALEFLMQGYGQTARTAIGEGLFEECHQNMVVVATSVLLAWSITCFRSRKAHGPIAGRRFRLSKMAGWWSVCPRCSPGTDDRRCGCAGGNT